MNDSDRAARHLRMVRDLPLMVESAFRAAVREAVFVRSTGQSLEAVLLDRARFHLNEMVRGTMVGISLCERSHAFLAAMVARFAKSPLAKRLARMPIDRIHVATLPLWDLLVNAADGRRFLIRFTCDAEAVARHAAIKAWGGTPNEVDGLLVYACQTAALRRFGSPVTPLVRSA